MPSKLDKQLAAIRERHGKYCECFLCKPSNVPPPLLSNKASSNVLCERCKKNPASADFVLTLMTAHDDDCGWFSHGTCDCSIARGERRAFIKTHKNLCASCGFEAPTWRRPSGNPPQWTRYVVACSVSGCPSNRPRMPYKRRSLTKGSPVAPQDRASTLRRLADTDPDAALRLLGLDPSGA